MYCSQCGNQLHEKAVICVHCGCATARYPEVEWAVDGPQESTASPVISLKSGVAAVVFVALLGGFGVHRFYVGRIGSAVGMLTLFIFGYLILITGTALVDGGFFNIEGVLLVLLGASMLLGFGIWWIVDLIKISTSKFKDSKGLIIKL